MSSMTNTKPKGLNFYRTEKKTRQLKVLNSGKATRNAKGDITKEAIYQTTLKSGTRARVEPNRKWFENTRTISSKDLLKYTKLQETQPNEYVIRSKQLPLLATPESLQKEQLVKLQQYKNYADTFGPNKKRKRPTITQTDYQELALHSDKTIEAYSVEKDNYDKGHEYEAEKNHIFNKGQSKRIWNELYKVIDSSDVIIHVLDARDPLGTRCGNVIKHIKTMRHKQLVFVLNKVDLVPTWVTERWKKYLEKEYPTVAFHANINNPFGKASLINLLRQFSKLHQDKKQISVGFVGYPNVGKSSVINTLKQKKVCTVAPIPGETRVWQYVALMKRIYMIDCPGVVYATDDTDTDILLKGVVRVENVAYTEDHIQALIDRCRKEYLLRTYNLEDFTDANDFLTQIAVKSGKLLKGGEADCTTIAKMVLNDWVRGKIPYYTLPPDYVLTKDLEVEENEKKKIRVNQRTKNIRVVNGFMADDTRGPEGEGESEDEGDLAVEGEGVSEGEDSEDEEEEEVDPEANWDKVFGGIDSDTVDSSTEQADTTIASIDDLESEQEVVAATGDTDSEEEEEVKVKEVVDTGKRMTTNKKKSTNYYTNANVKNKNKSKVVKKAPGKVNFKKSLPKKK